MSKDLTRSENPWIKIYSLGSLPKLTIWITHWWQGVVQALFRGEDNIISNGKSDKSPSHYILEKIVNDIIIHGNYYKLFLFEHL